MAFEKTTFVLPRSASSEGLAALSRWQFLAPVAGHLLGVAAGVTIVGLAVLAPLLLLILFAWLTYRAWLRIRRERALS